LGQLQKRCSADWAAGRLVDPQARFEHAIAILIGKPPAEFSLAAAALNNKPPSTPIGIPSELLLLRAMHDL
jgi:outer membrane protein TolC